MDFRKVGFWPLLNLVMLMMFVAVFIHEAGHWTVLEILGKQPVWSFTSLVQIGDNPPLHPDQWIETTVPDGRRVWRRLTSALSSTEEIISLAAGPLASLLEVVLGLSLVRLNRNPISKQMGLVLALVESTYAIQYYIRRIPDNSGDEYFLAAYLGISKYAISIPLFCYSSRVSY